MRSNAAGTGVLVIDPECRSPMDHYFASSDFVLRALPGMRRTVVINRKADPDIRFEPGVTVHRWPDDRTLAGRMFRSVRQSDGYRKTQLRHNAKTIARLVSKAGLGPDDRLVIHSATSKLAHSLALAMEAADKTRWPRTYIRFLTADMPGAKPGEENDHEALARIARRWPKLHVYCETAELAETFASTYGYPDVGQWLIPLAVPIDMDPPDKPDPDSEFLVGFLGGKRPEQGMELIPPILRALNDKLEPSAGPRIRILFQRPSEKFIARMDSVQRAALDEVMDGAMFNERMKIEHLDPGIDNVAFRKGIFRSHVLVLPYDVGFYAGRGSGLITEGALSGTPLVVAEGFAMGNWQRMAGSPTATDPEGYAEAILKVAKDYPRFREGALKAGEAMRAMMAERVEAIKSGSA